MHRKNGRPVAGEDHVSEAEDAWYAAPKFSERGNILRRGTLNCQAKLRIRNVNVGLVEWAWAHVARA